MEGQVRRVEVNEALVRFNAKRMAFIAGLALAFQAVNAFTGRLLFSIELTAGAALLAFASVTYLVLYFRLKTAKKPRPHALRRLYRIFGVAFALCMLPFFMKDAGLGVPMNSILFYTAFTVAPMFPFQEKKAPFFLMALYPVLAAALCTQDWLYVASIAGLGAAGAVLSCSLHSGYSDIISSLRIESDTDDLTKLFNRKAGFFRMHALIALCRRMGRPAAAFYIDIDCFKSYNDTFGHPAGDHAILEVTACMRRCFARETDVLCRLGGEEFAVLIPVANANVAVMMAKRLIRMVSDLGMKAGKGANANVVTVSIGVAVMEGKAMRRVTLQALIDEADKQLYIAKTSGRNCIAHGGKVVYRN